MQKYRVKLVKESLDHFIEDSDPIHDMGIGGIKAKIKIALEGILRQYDMEEEIGNIEDISSGGVVGFMVEMDFGRKNGGAYIIQHDPEEEEGEWIAIVEDKYYPTSSEEFFETFEEAVDQIEGWIEYSLSN